MISYKHEGRPSRQGLNIYSSDNPFSAGFEIKIWRGVLAVRYSKITQRWKVRTLWLRRI